MIDAIQINTDGTMERIQIDQGAKALQDIVGGYIEAINPDGSNFVTFWLNEEGKLHGLPCNDIATSIWWSWMPSMEYQDFIVGNVVVTGGADESGNTRGVPEKMYKVVESYVERYARFKETHDGETKNEGRDHD